MKKVVCFLLIIITSLTLCSCSKNNVAAATVDTNKLVAARLEKLDNIKSFDDETIKALSVIIRTNILNGNDEEIVLDDVDEKLYNLASQTNGETLSNNENSNNIEYYLGDEKTNWKKEIKKTELLKFLSKNNISIANLSKLEINKNDDGTLNNLSIGGKNFSYEMLSSEFNFDSNNIYNISNNKHSIIVEGKGKHFEGKFDINKSKALSKKGSSYKDILKECLPNYEILDKN